MTTNPIFKIYILFSFMFTGACSSNILESKIYNNGINIIPKPQTLVQNEGFFELNKNVSFIAISNEEYKIASFFAEKLKQSTGFEFAISKKLANNCILLKIDNKSELRTEAYTLSVTTDGVVVNAKTAQGLFYAMASLMQLLPAEIEAKEKLNGVKWMIPCVEVQDSPRFEYRGYMLKASRNFIPIEYIKKHLDILALLKINKFHLDLTDNQDCKIEIKKYSALIEYANKRIDAYSKDDSVFYTQYELKELVKYAADRYITMTTEINFPSHATTTFPACPEISHTGEQLPTCNIWKQNWTPNNNEGMCFNYFQGDPKIEPICIGKIVSLESMYNFSPAPQAIREKGQTHFVNSVQANMWSEYIYAVNQLEYQTFPNVFALAEIGWTDLENKNFKDFSRRVNNAYVRLDYRNVNYHIPQPEQPFGSSNHVAFIDSVDMKFKTTRPIDMVYTIDGTEPTTSSPKYSKTLKFITSGTIKITSLLPSGKMSKVRNIKVEKQELSSAIELKDITQGLSMIVTNGKFHTSSDLKNISNWYSIKIKHLKEIINTDNLPKWKHDQHSYSAIATGYIKIPADGVYFISSNYTEIWIDNKLVIDNNGEVKRHCRNNSSMALKKGWHNLKIVFIENLVERWSSHWNKGTIAYRKSDSPKFTNITPAMLAY